MANLRLTRIKTSNSTLIRAQFTDELDPLLNTSNVEVRSNVVGVPDPRVTRVTISGDIMDIYVLPMTPRAAYFVEFKSANLFPFKSKNGQSFLLEDGNTNVPLIFGPEDPADPVRDILLNYLSGGVYNFDNRTLARDIVDLQATNLSRALHDIGQLKNDNYLEVLVRDERKVRGDGPFDRLNEEGAFEVVRVGKTETSTNFSTSFSFASFPKHPITLLRRDITNESLVVGSGPGTFDKLILTVNNGPVTKLTEVTLRFAGGGTFEYDLNSLGYQIKNPRYDIGPASTLLTLEDNQFKLKDSIYDDPTIPVPQAGDTIIVSYEFKSLGRIIDPESVTVSKVLESTREPIQPQLTRFSLAHAPVVTEMDIIPTVDGVDFLDPQANPPFSTPHPAFKNEIPFRLEGLPNVPGQYSINYETGEVYVYGAVKGDGSGDFPPGATYNYRQLFNSRLDYTFDLDTDPIHNPDSTGSDLVANPLRELIGQAVKVSFSFEQTLIPEIDFKAQVHKEVLDERIENRLTSTGSLLVKHSPITDVFRIYNETSGEVYPITRFGASTVYFSYNIPPKIRDIKRERAEFTTVFNETLIVDSEFSNTLATRVFKILLSNNRIISATDDVLGASFNSSATFSRNDIFQTELYFDGQILDVDTNTDRLNEGQYQIDYVNGVVYVGVATDQTLDLGSVNYKKPTINPTNPHVLSVSELYHSISPVIGINKKINYISFDEDEIVPSTFDLSDERFLNGDTTLPYILSDDTITVSDDIKRVRKIFDAYDLNNNVSPTDFSTESTVSGNIITLNSRGVEKKESNIIDSGLEINVTFISPGVEIAEVVSVVRISDNVQLWDSGGTYSGYTITLSGATGSPIVSDQVFIIYRLKLTGASTPIVDYNRGDYFVDYSCLLDEILVSYEHGDNCLDFRESEALNPGEEYFVTYKVGALRNSLLKNFGTLVDLPILNTFDTTLPRENYRDALQAALQSFTKGPTIPAIKEVVSRITHVDPEIIEAIFDVWSLGISHLYRGPIKYSGDLSIVPAKYDNGVLVKNPDETITFPVSSNLRLEEGTLETWVIPEWNGLDNDATLTFSALTRDGYTLSAESIFIGSTSFNPTYDSNNTFSINKDDELSPVGLPAAIFTQTGLFIYFNDDTQRWEVLAKDAPGDGYYYSGNIVSSGEVYDVRFITDLGEPGDILRSYSDKIQFKFNINAEDAASPDGYKTGDGYVPGYSFDGITFMADEEHYIFDFGKTENTNRFSLYKDGKGYLNFRVYNRGNNIASNAHSMFKVSADISNWAAGEKHHIAVSWKLNSAERRDEMHLFIDGFEVPNILRYGGRPIASTTDRFRTVSPEIVIGSVPLTTITNNDLNTTQGSTTVYSDSVDFGAAGIAPGDTIEIFELGFGTFTIASVAGNALVLSSPMPSTLTNVRFSVNPYSVVVSSELSLASNIIVSILNGGEETEIPGLRAEVPGYSISKNLLNQDVFTLLGNAEAGDSVLVRTLGLNHRRAREKQYIWGNTSSVLKSQLPPPINLDEAKITAVLLPLMVIGPDNSAIAANTFTAAGLSPTQPSNDTEGRKLSVRMTGGNVDFSTPATVTVFGTTAGGPVSETFTFTEAGTEDGYENFLTISSATAVIETFNPARNSASIEIRETFSITEPDGNSIFPIIRFSFKTQSGTSLEGDGSETVMDLDSIFLDSDIGNKFVISSPGPVAGTYTIVDRIDENTVVLSAATGSPFTGGSYDIFNVSLGRSGFQNGFFTFETAGLVDTGYPLKQGYYEFDYSAYLEVPFAPVEGLEAYVGSDFNGNKQAHAVIDELRILSTMLTDVRVGEILPEGQESITSDSVSLSPFIKNPQTLMLIHFDNLPFENDSDFYVSAKKEYLQSGTSVNSSFNQSLVIANRPLVFDNKGLLSTNSEGSIEFWVSPKFDTYNDPNVRFYFDASSSSVEETVSISNGVVKTAGMISRVLAVRLQTDIDNSGVNYFSGGSVEDDFQTIRLNKALPYQQTPVKIIYIPSGLSENRLSIFKDRDGSIVFNVRSGETDYQVKRLVFWERDSWHRIRVTFKFNRADNRDELRMWIDGEESGMILFGTGLIFGTGVVFGQDRVGGSTGKVVSDINFTDPINEIYIGSDYLRTNIAQAKFDNIKISNIALSPVTISGQAKDVNFSSNVEQVFPVIPDVFTTFLLDFDSIITKTNDFSILRDEKFGVFNFTLNILDSFGIVLDNAKINQVLETLIYALKPAQAKVTTNIIE